MRNQRGLTVIEMLITISVGSVVLTMLMGITANILLTRNVVEYTNRVEQELYDMNQEIRRLMGDTSYSSIYQPEGYEGEVILITREFDPNVIDDDDLVSLDRENFKVDILYLDLERQAIFYSTLYRYDADDSLAESTEAAIGEFIVEIDQYIADFVADPQGRLTSTRFIIKEGSSIRTNDDYGLLCEKSLSEQRLLEDFGVENIVSSCLSTYIEFDLNISYLLQSGNQMPERSHQTSLFIP